MKIAQLYYQREFGRAFNLSLRLLCPSRFSGTSGAETATEIIPYDSAMTVAWDKTSREVVETMMRIVLRTETRGWGGVLSDGTRRSVSVLVWQIFPARFDLDLLCNTASGHKDQAGRWQR